jgi:hypothetical protein
VEYFVGRVREHLEHDPEKWKAGFGKKIMLQQNM